MYRMIQTMISIRKIVASNGVAQILAETMGEYYEKSGLN